MSFWTHIVGAMHVDTHEKVDDIKKYVEDALQNAPKITGSERDVSVFVNPEPDYCVSIYHDCDRCQYKDTLKYHADGGLGISFECDCPADYECPRGEYQTRAIITVYGDLRDRMRAQTKKEWNAFHRYVAKELGFEVRIATCRIEGW